MEPTYRRCRIGLSVHDDVVMIRLRNRGAFDLLPGKLSEHRHDGDGHSLAKSFADADTGARVSFIFWVKEPDDDLIAARRAATRRAEANGAEAGCDA